MYPSNSNSNHNPITRPLFNNNDINPNSKFNDLPMSSSLFHFPSSHTPVPYEDAVNDLTWAWQQHHDLFFIQQQQSLTTGAAETVINSNMVADPKRDALNEGITGKNVTRKRSSKKDRHSKINTAHGPRDRRMRLSLDIARKFFDLQDMLGFDKASKTVEWLLNQSSSSIQEIMGSSMPGGDRIIRPSNSISSTTSECEGVSGIFDESINTSNNVSNIKVKIKSSSGNNKVKKKANRTAPSHKIARESRIIARERARKRTVEKKKTQQLGDQSGIIGSKSCIINEEIMGDCSKGLGSWSQFEIGEKGEESASIQGPKMVNHTSYDQLLGSIEYASGDSLVNINTGNWYTSTICNFPQTAHISHEHHFGDFEGYCGKPWE